MSGVRFSVALLAALALSGGAFGQNAPERFWLAGLYDGNRVVIYFDAVKLGLTSPPGARSIPPPPGARKIAPPAAFGFFDPMELAPDYVAGLQKKPGAERFAVGDRYDLLMGRGEVTTVKVTTLVGCPGDEQTGNDSYIGALAKLERSNSFLPLSPAYYLVRRHREAQSRTPGSPLPIPVIEKEGGLIDAPAAFDIETKIARIMDKQMTLKANAAERALAGAASPALSVQQFRIAGGDIRYVRPGGLEIGQRDEAPAALLPGRLDLVRSGTPPSRLGSSHHYLWGLRASPTPQRRQSWLRDDGNYRAH